MLNSHRPTRRDKTVAFAQRCELDWILHDSRLSPTENMKSEHVRGIVQFSHAADENAATVLAGGVNWVLTEHRAHASADLSLCHRWNRYSCCSSYAIQCRQPNNTEMKNK